MKLFSFTLLFWGQLAFSGLETDLWPKRVKNGGVFLAKLSAKPFCTSASVEIGAVNAPLVPGPRPGTYFALVGVPYRVILGRQTVRFRCVSRLKVEVQSSTLEVYEGPYKSEKLQVSQNKVAPNKASLQRIREERKITSAIYKKPSVRRYWQKPFAMPIKSKITSAYGNKRMFNGELASYHSGLDLRAPTGTPIKATASGVVRLAKSLFYSGNCVVLDHGTGLFSTYSHLSKILVKPGQVVGEGQKLGKAGSTGRVNGPHLHWGAKVHGVNIDPLELKRGSEWLYRSLRTDKDRRNISRSGAF